MTRIAILAAALGAGLAALSGAPSPAQARDYPWCVDSGRGNSLGDCSYATYKQCQDSASGRGTCNRNPRVAFDPRESRTMR
jgi:hypothetical protein